MSDRAALRKLYSQPASLTYSRTKYARLVKRAEDEGVSDDDLAVAEDADDPNEAVIELLLAALAPPLAAPEPEPEEPAPGPDGEPEPEELDTDEGVGAAMDWVQAHQIDDDIDDPLPPESVSGKPHKLPSSATPAAVFCFQRRGEEESASIGERPAQGDTETQPSSVPLELKNRSCKVGCSN